LVNDLETKLAQQNSEQNLLALGHAWDEMKQSGMAAFYFEKIERCFLFFLQGPLTIKW
jgi:hypothetical protein